jgi:hypothetical protein
MVFDSSIFTGYNDPKAHPAQLAINILQAVRSRRRGRALALAQA